MYRIRIRNELAENAQELELYLNVNIEHDCSIDDYLSASRLRARLNGLALSKIIMHVNSDGGDVLEALAIYDMLKEYSGQGVRIEAIVEGVCASSAVIVLMSGDIIKMQKNSYIMIHEITGQACGTSEDFADYSGLLSEITNRVISIYTERTGLNEQTIRDLMSKESWLNADTSKALGFCDEVIDVEPKLERVESRRKDSQSIQINNNYKPVNRDQAAIKHMAEIINKRRGYVING